MEDVRLALGSVDLVSLKIDATSIEVWKRVNRPKRIKALHAALDGILAFSMSSNGEFIRETMLVNGVNDDVNEIVGISQLLSETKPAISYISIPTRPRTEPWMAPVYERMLSITHILFTNRSLNTEHLILYEETIFEFLGDIDKDLLSITTIHPMRKDTIWNYLEKTHTDWKEVGNLNELEKLTEVRYKQDAFYARKLR